jgi:hypothetical protein
MSWKACPPVLSRFVVFALIAFYAPMPSLFAAGLGRAMREISEQLGKSGDELTKAVGDLVRHSADSGDEALERLAKDLDSGGNWAELADAMKKAGISDAGALRKQFDGADDATRKVLGWVFTNGGKAIDAAVKGGGSASDAVAKIIKGGPRAMDALKLVDDVENLRACLDGFAKHGDRFPDFVIKGGGDRAATFWRKYGDEIAKSGDEAIDDLLKRPAKYLDEVGEPTRAFGERFARNAPLAPGVPKVKQRVTRLLSATREATVAAGRFAGWVITNPVTALFWLFTGAWLTGKVDPLLLALGLPASILPTARALLSLGIVWIAVQLLLPWLVPAVRWGLSKTLRSLAGIVPKRVGGLLGGMADRVPDWQSPIGVSVPKTDRMTIGIVGTKRVGKTTFIVMLAKHLSKLVSRASLIPYSDGDRKKLAEISADVSRGQPTRDDKTIDLDLTWPFVPGRPAGEGGTTNKLLVLTDFPGEWAAADADEVSRRKLLAHLRGVDGLMVVLDPTTLESDSVRYQLDAVERLFMREGIDLGRRFKRAMAIVVTKRDAITPELLSSVRRSGGGEIIDESRVFELSARSCLSEEESKELGRLMLELIAPKTYESYGGRLEREEAVASPSFATFLSRRTTKPQLAVFAISQLGRSLGAMVVAYREQVAAWEKSGRRGPKPSLELDLEGSDPKELEVHYPFRWLFDAIPEGLLHQANAMVGVREKVLRWNVQRRFKGAPAVARDIVVGWRRVLAGAAAVLVFVAAVPVITDVVNRRIVRYEINELRNRMLASRLEPGKVTMVLESLHPSNPDQEQVKTLTRFVRLAEDESKVMDQISDDSSRTLESSLAAARDLGVIASFRREPVWERDQDLVDASVARLEETVLRALTQETMEEAATLEQAGSFTDALGVVDKSRGGVPGGVSPALASEIREQLNKKRQTLEEAKARRELGEAKDELGGLSGLEAVRRIDQVILPESVPPALRETQEELRRRIVDEFWQTAKTKAATLNDAGQVEEATEAIDGFLAVPPPNHHAPMAGEMKNALKGNYVNAAVGRARGFLQNDETNLAWETLDKARAYRDATDEPTRLAWWDAAVEVKLRQRDHAGAVTLLTQPEPGDERTLGEQMRRVIADWHNALLTSTDSLVAEQNFDAAYKGLAKFLDVAGRDADPALTEEIMSRIKTLGFQRLRDELRVLESGIATEPGAAYAGLEGIGGRIVAEKNPELESDWAKLFIDSGRTSGRIPDALRALGRVLPEESAVRRALQDEWLDYAEDVVVKRATEAIVGKKYAEAWRLFRRAADEPSAPEAYRTKLLAAADQAWRSRLEEINASTARLCEESKFSEASDGLKLLREEEVKELLETSLPTSKDLDQLQRDVEKRELAYDVVRACAVDDARSVEACGRLHEVIRKVLKEPKLIDEQRMRVSRAEDALLQRWHDIAYGKIHKLHADYDFDTLAVEVSDYLSANNAYARRIDEGHRDAVRGVKQWLDSFDAARDYTVTAISVAGVPSGTASYFFSNLDPAFRLKSVAVGDPASASIVEGQRNSVIGASNIPSNGGNRVLRWSKGCPLTIDWWEGEVDADGWKYGTVQVNSQYALPSLVYKTYPLDAQGGDYDAAYFAKFTARVLIRDWPALPPLPSPQSQP